MNKQIVIGTLAAAMIAAPAANAGGRHGSFYDYAKVTHVEPIVRVVDVRTPREECWEEEVRYGGGHGHGHGSAGAMIVGGVIGGVVGHQFGRGRGRDAATAAGALIGAAIGHDKATRHSGGGRYEEIGYERRCRVVDDHRTEEQIEGYNVTYRYHGETFSTRLPYDPGRRLKVQVRVTPERH